MFFVVALLLKFILQLRFPRNVSKVTLNELTSIYPNVGTAHLRAFSGRQICQLSQICRETPGFEWVLPVYKYTVSSGLKGVILQK